MNPAYKILLVDDDEDFLLQQTHQFRENGFEVFGASNLNAARTQFHENKPHLAVIDMMMEQMDAGIILAHEFKKARPEMPIIMVTGVTRETGLMFDPNENSERSWFKADVILPKPIRFSQLKREVDTLLLNQA